MWDAAAWAALKECLPDVRQPVLRGAFNSAEVRALLTRIEVEVRRDARGAFEWDDRRRAGSAARLVIGGRSYRAGRFETWSIGDLESRVRRRQPPTVTAAAGQRLPATWTTTRKVRALLCRPFLARSSATTPRPPLTGRALPRTTRISFRCSPTPFLGTWRRSTVAI
jgi:hypothetical protein